MSALKFGPEDILAFENVLSPSGELQGIDVTLKDGSQHLCQRIDEIGEVLAMIKKLKESQI